MQSDFATTCKKNIWLQDINSVYSKPMPRTRTMRTEGTWFKRQFTETLFYIKLVLCTVAFI